jgi:hypothetical protein
MNNDMTQIKETIIDHNICKDLKYERVNSNLVNVKSATNGNEAPFCIGVLSSEQAKKAVEGYERALKLLR